MALRLRAAPTHEQVSDQERRQESRAMVYVYQDESVRLSLTTYQSTPARSLNISDAGSGC